MGGVSMASGPGQPNQGQTSAGGYQQQQQQQQQPYGAYQAPSGTFYLF